MPQGASAAWMRHRLTEALPKKPWDETPEADQARLKLCVAYVGNTNGVENLCMGTHTHTKHTHTQGEYQARLPGQELSPV